MSCATDHDGHSRDRQVACPTPRCRAGQDRTCWPIPRLINDLPRRHAAAHPVFGSRGRSPGRGHLLSTGSHNPRWNVPCVNCPVPSFETCIPRPSPPLLALGLQCRGVAADEDAPKGPAVTVLKVAKSCFSDIVEATGSIIAREETAVRPERPGLKVTEVLAEAGDTITAGQVLARLALPEGGSLQITAPVAGVIATSTAQIGNSGVGQGRGAVHDRGAQRIRSGRTGRNKRHAQARRQPAGDGPHIPGSGRSSDGKVRRIGADRGAQHPAGPRLYRHLLAEAAAAERGWPRADQVRAELQRRGAAHRRAIFIRRAPWCS